MHPMIAGRDVTIVSPHFDDVALSLGQSLRDGELSRARRVRVRVVFGRTNWTTRFHPTRRRAPLVSAWRRAEELLAALRFGYTVRVADLEEVILRSGSTDPASYRDVDLATEDPLVSRVTAMMRTWMRSADVLLVPAGLGGHLDHRIVATAGVRAVRAGLGPVGFYEDRPYVAYMSDAEVAAELAGLGLSLSPRDVSGAIEASTQRAVRRIYRSQMDEYSTLAQALDLDTGRPERVWVR